MSVWQIIQIGFMVFRVLRKLPAEQQDQAAKKIKKAVQDEEKIWERIQKEGA